MGYYTKDLADKSEPKEAGFVVTYDGDVVSEIARTMAESIIYAKIYTKALCSDNGFQFEEANIELLYETDEDDELVWENVKLKTVDYDSKRKEWEIK